MGDYVTLLGSENVKAGGTKMMYAAEEMAKAVVAMGEHVDRMARILEDHAQRIEAAMSGTATVDNMGPR